MVWRNIKELEAEGLATKEMVEEARRNSSEEAKKASQEQREINGAKEIDEKLKRKVLRLLKKGLSSKLIIKELNITSQILRKVKKQLIKDNQITPKEIKKAQENKVKRDKRKILKLLLKGLSIPEIVEQIEYAYYDYVQDLIKELKDEGKITDEEIKKARFERNQREIMEFVIEGFTKGLNQQEIADGYQEKYEKTISRQSIGIYKKRIIDEGIKTEEEIEEAQKKRQIEKNEAEKRRKAINEMGDNLDLEIVKIQIEYVKAKFKLGEEDETDVEKLGMLIQNTPSLITGSNINFIITYYTRKKKLDKAIDFIEECMENKKDDKAMVSKLEKAREEIFSFIEKSSVIQKLQGQIGERKQVAKRRRIIGKMITLSISLRRYIFEEHFDYTIAQLYLGKEDKTDINLLKDGSVIIN